jgi:hypothetical protein
MRNLALLVAALLLPSFAFSADVPQKTAQKQKQKQKNIKRKPAHDGSGIHVVQLDPDFPIEKLESPDLETHPLSEQKFQSGPMPNLRDGLLAEVGLDSYTKSWDHFEKDMLMQRLMHQSVNEVSARYSALPREALEQLKKLLLAMKSGE